MIDATPAIEQCRPLLDEVCYLTESLSMALSADNGCAFYQCADSDTPMVGRQARKRISEDLMNTHYTGLEMLGKDKHADRFMAAASSTDTLAIAQKLNGAKTAFKKAHIKLRNDFKTEREATEFFRYTVLKALNEPLLNVATADRLIPAIFEPITHIRWSYNCSAPTRKTTVKAAMAHIAEWMKDCSERRLEILSSELDRLGAYNPDTPVSQQLRAPVKSLRYRATYVTPTGQRIVFADYGRSPILYLDQDQVTQCKLPGELFGDAPAKGRGRHKIVSKNKVSPYLKGWFWYRNQPLIPENPEGTETEREGSW